MTLAAEHPERVTKLALIGSTALVPVKRGDWLWTNAHALKAPLDPGSDFLREWHPANQPTPVDKAFAEAAMAEILAIPLHVWRGVMRELADVPAGRHAADIKAPVLILSGGKDPLFPAEHHAALVEGVPPRRGAGLPRPGPQSQLGAAGRDRPGAGALLRTATPSLSLSGEGDRAKRGGRGSGSVTPSPGLTPGPLPQGLGRNSSLPDADPLLGRQVHLVARLDVERLVPGVDVADDSVDPIFGRAVRVGEQPLAKRALADLRAPRTGRRR